MSDQDQLFCSYIVPIVPGRTATKNYFGNMSHDDVVAVWACYICIDYSHRSAIAITTIAKCTMSISCICRVVHGQAPSPQPTQDLGVTQ